MLRLLPFAALLALAVPASAQPVPNWAEPLTAAAPPPDPGGSGGPGGTPGTPGGPDSPVQTPVDGGLGLLALAGGAYAVRRLRKS